MNKYIVIVNGLGGVGKSEFIKYCQECPKTIGWSSNFLGVMEKSTVDYVKVVAKYCGWKGSKEAKDRIFLSDLKKALEKWNNSPLLYLIENINSSFGTYESLDYENAVIFINSREAKDIEFLVDYYYGKCDITEVYIENKNVASNEVPELVAEIKEYGEDCDYIIHNNGSKMALFSSAIEFLHDLLGLSEELHGNVEKVVL